MSSTMTIIGAGTACVFIGALVAMRRDDELLAASLLAVGSGLATIWSLLAVGWARRGHGDVSPTMYLSLTLMAGLTTIYFSLLVRSRLRNP